MFSSNTYTVSTFLLIPYVKEGHILLFYRSHQNDVMFYNKLVSASDTHAFTCIFLYDVDHQGHYRLLMCHTLTAHLILWNISHHPLNLCVSACRQGSQITFLLWSTGEERHLAEVLWTSDALQSIRKPCQREKKIETKDAPLSQLGQQWHTCGYLCSSIRETFCLPDSLSLYCSLPFISCSILPWS